MVVGGANGIGRATVQRLNAEGARVVIVDRDEHQGTALAADSPREMTYISCDVRDPAQIKAAAHGGIEWGQGLDYLVQTAGTFTPHGVLSTGSEDWDLVIEINLRSQVLFMQACAAALADRRGAIVNIASIEADVLQVGGSEATASYAASKAGVRMASKSAAYDLASRGVRVNTVDPGFIRTGFGGDPGFFDQDPRGSERFRRIVLGRWGEPEDVAAGIAFLLSDDASYITGISLVIDGGWTLQ
jgi:NAD(P)-dependent dehydrogenase (short-subunit alcohol dehydrogenase family)